MQYQGFLIVFLGLLGSFTNAYPDREKRQVPNTGVPLCQQLSNVSCTSEHFTVPSPLNKINIEDEVRDCECVLHYRCTAQDNPNDDGTILSDRISSNPCLHNLEVCCRKAFILPDTSSGTGGIVATGRTGTTGSKGTTVGTGTTGRTVPAPGPTPSTLSPFPVRSGCGYRNPNGVGVRITGADNQAQFAEFPWMVAVLERAAGSANRSSYTSGGSLIHPRVILTAAHNLENKSPANLIIRAGEWDTQTDREPIQNQEREVAAVLLHENFNPNNLHSDIALVIVKKAFDVAPNVNVICLPQASEIFDAQRCTVTGWGKDNFEKSGTYQAVLKKIVLPVVPHQPCETALRQTRLGKNFILDQSFICAGGEPKIDTCTGDGGSPLVCPLANGQDRYVQAGIAAWGIGCGADRTPGVYGSVTKARQWIDSKMAQYNLEIPSYVA